MSWLISNTWRCLNKSNNDSTVTAVSLLTGGRRGDVRQSRGITSDSAANDAHNVVFYAPDMKFCLSHTSTFYSVSLGKTRCLEKYKDPACEWMLTWAVYTRLKWKIWRPLYEITRHRGLQLLNTAAAGWSRNPPNCWIKGRRDGSPAGGVQQGRSLSVTVLYLVHVVYLVSVYTL